MQKATICCCGDGFAGIRPGAAKVPQAAGECGRIERYRYDTVWPLRNRPTRHTLTGKQSVGFHKMDQPAPVPADPDGQTGGYPDDDRIRALPDHPPGFKCTACGDCCRAIGPDMGVTLNYPDVLRLSAHLHLSPEDFIEIYTEHVIFAVGEKKYEVFYLNFDENACRFLGPDNLCTIHSVKPWQCRHTLYRFFHSDDRYFWCQKQIEVPPGWTSSEHDAIFMKGLREVPAQTQEAQP